MCYYFNKENEELLTSERPKIKRNVIVQLPEEAPQGQKVRERQEVALLFDRSPFLAVNHSGKPLFDSPCFCALPK